MPRRGRLGAGVSAVLVAVGLAALPAVPAAADATTTVAQWGMNEAPGGTVMRDRSANGIHGRIGGAVATGVSFGGATGYRWSLTGPDDPPAKPQRLVTVDDARLNPGSRAYAVTMRFRTTQKEDMNILQKGQAGSAGGYFKLEIEKGKLTCLFRGRAADGSVRTRSVNSGAIPLNDGAWHTVRCERTAQGVSMTVDGQRTFRRAGSTGSISNQRPLSIGGKSNCDQHRVDCDYFSGGIASVRIQRG